MTARSRRAVSAGSAWAPLARLGHDDVDDAERELLGGRHAHRERPPSGASSAVRHRIEAQPSGLMTE